VSKVETALASVGGRAREAFLAHLRGGTSAVWLSDWLSRAGHPVSATTIKDYRKKVRDDGL
jgi:hypothetical protein